MQVAKVTFLVDFRGKLTNENYYLAGSTVEFDSGVASQLVSEGRAAYVEAEEVTEEPTEPVELEPVAVDEVPKRRKSKKAQA